jgi:hypothetical protein
MYGPTTEDGDMTSTPDSPVPNDDDDQPSGHDQPTGDPAGAEMGMSDGEPNTFEPEEDPDATA